MRKQLSLRAAKQAGFTLIELIIVIVIIGILAAVAIPKYTSLTTEAKTATLQGLAGNIASASALNQALFAAGKSTTAVTTCANANTIVNPAIDTTTFTVTEGTANTGTTPKTVTCTINYTTGAVTAVGYTVTRTD